MSDKPAVRFTGVRPSGYLQKEDSKSVGTALKRELPPEPTMLAPENDIARKLKGVTAVKTVSVGVGDIKTTLKVELTSIDPSALLGPGEAALRKAQKFIDESKFREALDTLNGVLREAPSLVQANYLAALCEFRLGEHKSALKRLHLLSDRSIEIKKKALQAEVRTAAQPILEKAVIDLVLRDRIDEVIATSKEWVDLDPGCGLFGFYYITGLMAAGRSDQARKAADTAIGRCDDNYKSALVQLRADIDQADLEHRLADVRTAYRNFNYSKARRLMDKVPQIYRSAPLWNTMRNYLEALGGGFFSSGLEPSAVKPQGTRDDVDKMYHYLIAEDISAVSQCLASGSVVQARDIALFAARMAPHYSYANYLAAMTIYTLVRMASARGDLDLLNLLDTLAIGRKYSAVAAADPSLGDATKLCAAFDQAIGMFEAIKQEIEAQMADVQEIAGLDREFNAIFQAVGNGISSVAQFEEIRHRFQALDSQARNALSRLRTQQGRTNLQAFRDAVAGNLKQLSELEPDIREAEEVNELWNELGAILEPIKQGIRDSKQHREVTESIRQLQDDARKLRKRLKREDSGKLLSKLIETLDARAGELKKIGESMAAQATIEPLFEEFKSLMERVNAKKISLDKFESGMENLARKVEELDSPYSAVNSDSAREQIRQLKSVIADRLDEARQAKSSAADSEVVQPVIQFYNSMMDAFKNRAFDRDTARTALEFMEKQIREARPKVYSNEAKRSLDQMEEVVDKYLDQVR